MSLFLCLQGHTYHYRKVIPIALRPYLGKREIKKSLETGNKLEARGKALLLAVKVERAITQSRKTMSDKSLSKSEKTALIAEYFHFLLMLQDRHLDRDYADYPIMRMLEKEMGLNVQPNIDALKYSEEYSLEDSQYLHKKRDYEQIKTLMPACACINGKTITEADLTGSFLQALSLAQIDANKLICARKNGENPPIPSQYDLDPIAEAHDPIPKSHSTEPSVPFKQVIEEYTKDRLAIGKWTDKTKDENHALYNNFIDFAGTTITCAEINYHLISDFREALKKLPVNRNKFSKYRNKTISQLIEMDVEKTISTTTVNKNLNRLSTLLKFAVKLGYMPNNPAEGMEIPVDQKDSEQREVFSNADLQKLFNSSQYIADNFAHAFMFWFCPIALFTGMRQTEIAQLHLSDIYQKDGVWVIDVNDDSKNKKIKNKNARRLIPLHSFLSTGLNLPNYAAHLKSNGYDRLFPELSYGRDGYGQAVSRWFNGHGDGVTNGYKKACGIKGQKKVFHSFRHTLINHLKQKQVDQLLLHEFDGHSHGTMTLDRYGKAYTPQLMYDQIVSQITFDKELDLGHLMKSKFVLD
ncbi:site-specific integrase [Desulfovibrio sp. Fe33]|uniref:site-specific integrase n=1 Tax=Desulfovibrio sp. Fe33 TaxID=3020842 RepID=UPI00234D874A|nr:site-specific integrase [Desulfovibrio sp. Fe33]